MPKEAYKVYKPHWLAPTLQNSWVNYDVATTPAGYYKDQFGFVHLRGIIKDGTATDGTIVFTLPAGYRPEFNGIFVAITDTAVAGAAGAVCRVDVLANGEVRVYDVDNTFVSLDGIHFTV